MGDLPVRGKTANTAGRRVARAVNRRLQEEGWHSCTRRTDPNPSPGVFVRPTVQPSQHVFMALLDFRSHKYMVINAGSLPYGVFLGHTMVLLCSI